MMFEVVLITVGYIVLLTMHSLFAWWVDMKAIARKYDRLESIDDDYQAALGNLEYKSERLQKPL